MIDQTMESTSGQGRATTRPRASGSRAEWPDLGLLSVEKIIVHDVPQHRAGDASSGPTLSEVESPANVELRNFVRERVIETLVARSFVVKFVEGSTSPLPRLIAGQLRARPRPFVKMSQEAAAHLHQVQTGQNPAGLLVVLRGSLGDVPALGLMKLEREEAIRLNQERIHGRRTFSLEHLRDLMLSKKTRVFKTGLFWVAGDDTIGLVCDMQLGRDLARDVANFFLEKFLGCQLADEPAVVTKRFWDAAERFINEHVTYPLRQTAYLLALTTEMASQKPDVSPRGFAAEHVEAQDRDQFNTSMSEAGLETLFIKDTRKIAGRIERVQYEFASGIRLTGPVDEVRERVVLEEGEGGRTRVEFEDHLKGVHGKGR